MMVFILIERVHKIFVLLLCFYHLKVEGKNVLWCKFHMYVKKKINMHG